MTDFKKIILCLIAIAAIVVYVSVYVNSEGRECESDGGIYVKGFMGWQCITKESFKE